MTRHAGLLGTVLAACLAPPVAAEAVTAPGQLSDGDFYRLVSCGAPPGAPCARDPIRWETRRGLRVALRRIDPGYTGRRRPRASAALTRAIDEINAAGAGLRLAQVPAAAPAEIVVYFLDQPEGAAIAGTGLGWVDGSPGGPVATRIATRSKTQSTTQATTQTATGSDRTQIVGAAIVVGSTLETAAFEPALLRALTHALGLTTEVAGPAYAGRSALAAGRPERKTLGIQDRAALMRHYAAPLQ